MHGNTEASAALERRASRKNPKSEPFCLGGPRAKSLCSSSYSSLCCPNLTALIRLRTTITYGLANLHRWAHDFNCNGMNATGKTTQQVPSSDKPWLVNVTNCCGQ